MSAHLTKAGRKLRWCHATRREWKKCQEANICVQDIVEQYSTLISSVIWKQTIKIELVISNITFSRDKANCRIRYLIFVWFRSKSKEQLNERWAGLSTFSQLGSLPQVLGFLSLLHRIFPFPIVCQRRTRHILFLHNGVIFHPEAKKLVATATLLSKVLSNKMIPQRTTWRTLGWETLIKQTSVTRREHRCSFIGPPP